MMPKQGMPTFVPVDLHFPLAGIDKSRGFDRQPNRQTADGQFARTTPAGVNVRAFDVRTGRARGGQRAGLDKYIAAQPSGRNAIQLLAAISGVGYSAPGGGVQTSSSGRVVTLVTVSEGNVKVADAGATSYTAPTGYAAALNTSGVVFAAPNVQKLWFADGTNWKYYDPATNTVSAWTASAGSLPVDADNNAPRLIETWRGRTILSGLLRDPQNWFMSKVGDPLYWQYSPLSPSPTDPIAGNNSTLGKVGDVITALIPFSDDVLFFGGDHTLWMMRGDPLAGGDIHLISDAIGVAWGRAWCKDPYGAIYFVSNRMGIYKVSPSSMPQRISQQIEQLLSTVNTGSNTISLAWDDRFQGLHVFVTRTSGPYRANHLFWEMRTGAWWLDTFENIYQNPLCCTVFDGNEPDDRVTLIGSWDGYIRFLNPDATKDDGYAIASSVVIGPLLTKDLDALLLKELVAVLGEDSGDVGYAIYVGSTAEAALASEPIEEGVWTAGRNDATYIQAAAHAVYVKLTATSPWAMEAIRAMVSTKGKVAARRSS